VLGAGGLGVGGLGVGVLGVGGCIRVQRWGFHNENTKAGVQPSEQQRECAIPSPATGSSAAPARTR